MGCQVQLEPSCAVDGARTPADVAVERDAPMCPGPPRDGSSPCFFDDCGAGLYCDDAGAPHCRPGCASDHDCGPRDTCVREGAATVGRCEPCAAQPAHTASPGCVVPSRSGTTACFHHPCGPGQYCDESGLTACKPGCASDENCGASESCVRAPGATVGACRSCFFAR